jgi:hypothetical protein
MLDDAGDDGDGRMSFGGDWRQQVFLFYCAFASLDDSVLLSTLMTLSPLRFCLLKTKTSSWWFSGHAVTF